MAGTNELLIIINGNAKNFLDEADKIKKKTESLEKVLSDTAKISGLAFASLTAVLVTVTKAFADYETALVGVGKTTNIEGKKLQDFGKAIQEMSKRIPVAANELLGIAQAAGQLGVSGEQNLIKFTETVAKLGVATDLSGEEAATALTRILTVTREGVGTIDRFGSVIVALGNNFAATESEIVRMTTEVARATALYRVSATDAAALGTAMRSIGIRAELGGSAVGRAFREIDASIRAGGERLTTLSQLTGMTGDQLKKTFKNDSTAVFQAFLSGLKGVADGGGDVVKVLEQFDLKSDEILKVLPSLANNTELVNRALRTAQGEYQKNTALSIEAAKAFDTLNNRSVILKNSITALAVDMGQRLAPDARKLVDGLITLVAKMQALDEETKSTLTTLLKVALVVTGAITALSTLGLGALAVIKGFATLKIAALAVGAAIGALSLPVVAITAAVGVLGFGLSKLLNADKGSTATSIDEVNTKLAQAREIMAKQLAIQKDLGKQDEVESKAAIGRLQEKIGLLEQQKKTLEETSIAARKADQSFGTGGLLRTDKVQTEFSPLTAPTLPGDTSVSIPLQTEGQENAQKDLDALKAAEAERGNIVDEGVQRRIQARGLEREKILDDQFKTGLQQVTNLTENERGLIEKELEFSERRRQIKAEQLQAKEIENTQEREAALENSQLKNESLLLEEEAFAVEKDRIEIEERERKAALNEELRELDLEDRARLRQEDLDLLGGELQTEDEAKRAFAVREAQRNIESRNKELADRAKYGAAVSKLNQFFNSEEVQGVKQATSNLTQLRQSSNKKQQEIGKAAARVQAALATAQGAIQAYTSLSVIPIVGPALGIAAAAALTAYGIEQQSKINSVSTAASGGVVPGGIGGARDRVPMMLNPGELIVPQQLRPTFLESQGRPEGSSGQGGDARVVEIVLKTDLIRFVEDGLQERKALGITSSGGLV